MSLERINGADVLDIIKRRLTRLQFELVAMEAERDKARAERDRYRKAADQLRVSRDKWRHRANGVEPRDYIREEPRSTAVRYETEDQRQAARRETWRMSARRRIRAAA